MTPEPSGERATLSKVTFTRPFRIGDDPTEMPAGTYVIHTRALAYTTGDRTTFIPFSVDLEVPEASGRTAYRVVRPSDMSAAQARDG
ncbi:MAG: hypothetical protein K0S66_2641 [Sphingomonas sp.]|nr:hypothetical protein [Sphingomonas sp.]